MTLPCAPATFNTPALGLDLVILDENGAPTDNGEVFIVPPSIGLSGKLLHQDHHEVYYSGTPRGPHGELLRRHGDQIELQICFRGQGRVVVDGVSHPLVPGTACFLGHDVKHEIWN